jgi:hypothetical protein
MTTESKHTDYTNTAAKACAHVRGHTGAGALTFRYVTNAITTDKTFRERQISICLNRTPRETYVNTKPRADARATGGLAPHDAGTVPGQT